MWSDWLQADCVPYLPVIVPADFWDKAMFQGGLQLVASEITPAKAAANATAVATQWAAANPPYKQRYDMLRHQLAK